VRDNVIKGMYMKVVIMLGAPGAGKGTTTEKIGENLKFIGISTGDMLRAALKSGTETGLEAESYMKKGELVPDDVIIRLMEARFDQPEQGDAEGVDLYFLDGFPRTIEQADLLSLSLVKREGELKRVYFLDAPREVLIARLTGRRTCKQCGTNFHVMTMPPKQEGVCDECGAELYQRPDDQEETIVNRLDVYNKQTERLIAYYESKGLLVRVDANRHLDDIAAEIVKDFKEG
jgi:adenylate kinase